MPATDGLFLGSDTKRWDGSKLINLDAADITSGVLSADRGGLGVYLSPTWTNQYTLVYRTIPAPARWVMVPKWGHTLSMLQTFFDSNDTVVTGTTETVIYQVTDVPSKAGKIYIPSFSADYRFTDLQGTNPLCTMRLYFSKDGGETYRQLNYVEFQGVDLYRHPVALVRALADYDDFLEFAGGFGPTNTIVWEVKAVLDTADADVVFANKSFSGIIANPV
jgi:hypothetical protein